jgi:hypothetical protein
VRRPFPKDAPSANLFEDLTFTFTPLTVHAALSSQQNHTPIIVKKKNHYFTFTACNAFSTNSDSSFGRRNRYHSLHPTLSLPESRLAIPHADSTLALFSHLHLRINPRSFSTHIQTTRLSIPSLLSFLCFAEHHDNSQSAKRLRRIQTPRTGTLKSLVTSLCDDQSEVESQGAFDFLPHHDLLHTLDYLVDCPYT